MDRLIEIRTYQLKPGAAATFHEVMGSKAVPFIRSKGMDVVAHGHSDHEEPTYYLIRAYADRDALIREQTAFYGSSDWAVSEIRAELLSLITGYVNTLLRVSEASVEDMRRQNTAPHPKWRG